MHHSRLHSELLAISESKLFHRINLFVGSLLAVVAIGYVIFEIIK